jgi:hypothetical protein
MFQEGKPVRFAQQLSAFEDSHFFRICPFIWRFGNVPLSDLATAGDNKCHVTIT